MYVEHGFAPGAPAHLSSSARVDLNTSCTIKYRGWSSEAPVQTPTLGTNRSIQVLSFVPRQQVSNSIREQRRNHLKGTAIRRLILDHGWCF